MKKILTKEDPEMKYTDTFKESTKKSLINKISKILLELEFRSNHLIKSKRLKFIVKEILSSI